MPPLRFGPSPPRYCGRALGRLEQGREGGSSAQRAGVTNVTFGDEDMGDKDPGAILYECMRRMKAMAAIATVMHNMETG